MHIEMIRAARRCRQWLVEKALPHWAVQGFDPRGGLFAEALDSRGEAIWQPVRFRVQSRQIYVYAHATLLGWYDGRHMALVCADKGMPRFTSGEGHDVFALGEDGQIADGRICCYEYAFALLAECWLYRLTGQSVWQQRAELRYQHIEMLFADTLGVGLQSTFPPGEPRSQNPHMHLFEAVLAAAASFDDPRWQERAHQLYRLFSTQFLEPHLLREFFDKDLKPSHEASRLVDPGHHYEWCWLLSHYQALAKGWPGAPDERSVITQRAILYHFAHRFGHGPTGLVMDEVTEEGQPWRDTSRLWCQTEYLKALVADYERSPSEEGACALGLLVEGIFGYYLTPALDGQWVDRVGADGKPLSYTAPASTFYHLFVAFTELVRVAEEGSKIQTRLW